VTAAAVLVCWSIGASTVQAQRFGLALDSLLDECRFMMPSG
jgi:hypothetical protein